MILCESGFYFHVRLQAGSLWSAKRREGFHKPFTSRKPLVQSTQEALDTISGLSRHRSLQNTCFTVLLLKMKGVCLLESFLVPEGGCWFSSSSLLLLQDKNSYPSHRKLTRSCPLIPALCKDKFGGSLVRRKSRYSVVGTLLEVLQR